MRRILVLVSALAAWLQIAASASGQNNRYYFAPPAASTVSPYLNLGVTQTGVSNYHTLVKPLIDEREALQAGYQPTNLTQLKNRDRQIQFDKQARDGRYTGPGDSTQREANGAGRPAKRFLQYSHYFSGER